MKPELILPTGSTCGTTRAEHYRAFCRHRGFRGCGSDLQSGPEAMAKGGYHLEDARVIHADAMKDKCRTYTPRIVGDKVMMPAVLKRLRLNTSALSLMRCARWSKSYGPSWHISCRRRGREAELIPRPVSVHHRKLGAKESPEAPTVVRLSRFRGSRVGDRADRKLLACEHGIGSGKVS
jgi:hypothetical protein